MPTDYQGDWRGIRESQNVCEWSIVISRKVKVRYQWHQNIRQMTIQHEKLSELFDPFRLTRFSKNSVH